MRQKNETEIILKQWVRVVLLIVVIAIMIASIVSIVKGLNPAKAGQKELYSYNYNSNLDYKVYLKDNSFFTTPYIGMNKQYIASLIDHIDVDTSYVFQSTKELDYSYNYEIVATAKGLYQNTEGQDVELWSKSYPIANQANQSGSGKTFTIDKTVSLDYNQYNQIMTDFRNQYGLSLDARVDLTMNINVTAGLKGASEKGLQDTNTIALEIPLLQQTINIKPNYVNHGSNTIYSEAKTEEKINIPLVAVGAVVLVIALIAFKILVKSLLAVTRKSEYVLALNKILKEYGDIIAETHNMPDIDKYDIINVKNFNDLVDVEEELHSPILYFEVRENYESIFLIISNNTLYKFTLRESDFDHFNKSRD